MAYTNDGSFSICGPTLIHDEQRTHAFKQTSVTSFTCTLSNAMKKKTTLGHCWVFNHHCMYTYRYTYRK